MINWLRLKPLAKCILQKRQMIPQYAYVICVRKKLKSASHIQINLVCKSENVGLMVSSPSQRLEEPCGLLLLSS